MSEFEKLILEAEKAKFGWGDDNVEQILIYVRKFFGPSRIPWEWPDENWVSYLGNREKGFAVCTLLPLVVSTKADVLFLIQNRFPDVFFHFIKDVDQKFPITDMDSFERIFGVHGVDRLKSLDIDQYTVGDVLFATST